MSDSYQVWPVLTSSVRRSGSGGGGNHGGGIGRGTGPARLGGIQGEEDMGPASDGPGPAA